MSMLLLKLHIYALSQYAVTNLKSLRKLCITFKYLKEKEFSSFSQSCHYFSRDMTKRKLIIKFYQKTMYRIRNMITFGCNYYLQQNWLEWGVMGPQTWWGKKEDSLLC